MIEIDGQQKPGPRFLVKIDGKDIWLTYRSFGIFVKLAFARTVGTVHWKHESELNGGARYIYRLKQELDRKDLIDNDRNGCYKLATDKVTFNHEVLRNHDDYEVSQLFPEVA